MSPEQFAYWLQGFIELHDKPPTAPQWKSIGEHLSKVFEKLTPPVAKTQGNEDFLRAIQHSGPTKIC